MIALVLALSLAAAAQDRETRTESWEDGSPKAEWEVVVRDGVEVRDGSFRSWHANGEEASRGRYEDGERTGKWRFWHDNGRKAAQGRYERGLRTGTWESWHPDRSEDLAQSGEYTITRDHWADGTLHFVGEERDGRRHGVWRSFHADGTPRATGSWRNGRRDGAWSWWWPSGVPLATGSFVDGLRDGEWKLWHRDGVLDPEMLTGTWSAGARTPPAPDAVPPAAPPAELPRPGLPADVEDLDREAFGRLIDAALPHGRDIDGGALAELVGWGRLAFPVVLERMLDADLTQVAGAQEAWYLHTYVLRAWFPGATSPWVHATAAESVAHDRAILRRWLTFWELTKDQPLFWAMKAGRLREGAVDFLAEPPFDPAWADSLGPHEPDAGRETPEGRAIAGGLAWLAAHQGPRGGWSSNAFDETCGEERCDGLGAGHRDVGVTALALLAFQGAGHTGASGPHAATVAQGIAWLLAQQDPDSGLVGGRPVNEFLYAHALATLALVEAAARSGDDDLRGAAQKAVDYLLRARNPYGAWRYDVPPTGENDTSITGWCVTALAAARAAGLEVEEAAFEGASAWLHEVFDPATGRTGYDTVGGLSARIPKLNDQYPVDRAEAMTAVGLFARQLLGEDLESSPALAKSVELLRGKLPEWDEQRHACDMYYWYYGTYALFRVGGTPWKAWSATLRDALLDHQRQDGHERGSWDPVGPWGVIGGRVYATAMMVLCLEVERRSPGTAR